MGRLAGLWVVGLSSCSGSPTLVVEVPEELRRIGVDVEPVPDRYLYGDVTRVRTGQWASYREGARAITLAAVGREGEEVWIEVIEEGTPRKVSARRVAPDGRIRTALYGEVRDGACSRVYRQDLRQEEGPPPARPRGARCGEETVRVGKRALVAQVERVRREEPDGRCIQEELLWHSEVPPLYAGSDAGGLVRLRAGDLTVDLLDFGSDAQPLLEIPR